MRTKVRQYYPDNLVPHMALVHRPRARNWAFTVNNPTEELDLAEVPNLTYAVWQLEVGENGTPHYQGYVMFNDRVELSYLRNLIAGGHYEVAKGTPAHNRAYCTKEGRIGEFYEIGIFPGTSQGKRTDLVALKEALIAGLTPSEYAHEYFDVFLRYPHLLQNWTSANVQPRSSADPVTCTLLIGFPGTGKSRLAWRLGNEQPGGVFRKWPGKWYDGYHGERTIILDDFRGSSLSFTGFKLLVDRYPFRVELKGSTCEMAATNFYITTNQEPDQWWKEEVTGPELSAIFRRFTSVWYFSELNTYHQFPSYSAYAHAVLTPLGDHQTRTLPPPIVVTYD